MPPHDERSFLAATDQVFYAGGQLGPNSTRVAAKQAVVHSVTDMQDVSDGAKCGENWGTRELSSAAGLP